MSEERYKYNAHLLRRNTRSTNWWDLGSYQSSRYPTEVLKKDRLRHKRKKDETEKP